MNKGNTNPKERIVLPFQRTHLLLQGARKKGSPESVVIEQWAMHTAVSEAVHCISGMGESR